MDPLRVYHHHRNITVEDPHRRYERRQTIWLFISFGLIALMAAGVMLLGAVQAGLVRRRR